MDDTECEFVYGTEGKKYQPDAVKSVHKFYFHEHFRNSHSVRECGGVCTPPPQFSLCIQDVVYNVAESILTEYFIWLQIVNLANRQTGKTCVSKHISAPVCCVFGLACLGHTKNTTKKTCSIENIEYFVWSCCIKQFNMYYQGCTYKCCHGYQMQRWAFDKMLPRRHLSESNRWKKSMNKMVTGLQCIYIIQCLSKEQYTYICSHRFRIHLFDTRNL